MAMIRAAAAALALALIPAAALAQTSPGLTYGQILTPEQWNNLFANKQDTIPYQTVNKAGDTMLGRLTTTASTTASTGLNIPQGTAPTSPNNGDLWSTTTGLFVQINGSTIGPLAPSAPGGPAALTQANDANVTISLGGTPSTALLQPVSLTMGWAGQLSGTRGGTGVNNGARTITVAGNFAVATNGGTLAFGAAGKTLTVNNTLAFTGTDGTTFTFPGTSDTVATLGATQTLASKTINGGTLSGTIAGTPTLSGANFVTLANVVQDATAWSLLGNATGGAANYAPFAPSALTAKASPGAGDIVMIADVSAGGQLKQTTVAAIAAGATVASVNTLTGALNFPGCGASGITVSCPQSGFLNKLRNSSLTSWFHGSGTITIPSSGAGLGWCAEGILVVPVGASITCAQHANNLSNPLTFWSQLITGNTSVTDITVRFPIESYDAAPLAGLQVTCQLPVLNNTGGSITPTLTVKRANTQDATYTNTDVSAVSLQTIANGSTGILAYSWAANASSFNGLSIDVDFGNNFSSNAKSIQIGGGFDCRVTPGIATGTVSSPPSPEIRNVSSDMDWNARFYQTSYANGIAPGTATHNGMVNIGFNLGGASVGNQVTFRTLMRAAPTLSSWDGAGNGNDYTTSGSGVTFTDGVGTTASGNISSAGFGSAVSTGSPTNQMILINYAVDASLTGG